MSTKRRRFTPAFKLQVVREIDAFSRRCVQKSLYRWAPGRTLEARLTIAALW